MRRHDGQRRPAPISGSALALEHVREALLDIERRHVEASSSRVAGARPPGSRRARHAAHGGCDADDTLGGSPRGPCAVAEQHVRRGAREQEQARDEREHREHEARPALPPRRLRPRACRSRVAAALRSDSSSSRDDPSSESTPSRSGRHRRGTAGAGGRLRAATGSHPAAASASGARTTARPAASSSPLRSAAPRPPPLAPAHTTSAENAASAHERETRRGRGTGAARAVARERGDAAPGQPACGQGEGTVQALAAPSRSCGGMPSPGASTRATRILRLCRVPAAARRRHPSERIGVRLYLLPGRRVPGHFGTGRVASVTAPIATDPLALDLEATPNALATGMRDAVRELGRRGAVLGVSGGVDSGVCAALCVRAFGPKHVLLPAHARARHRPGRIRPRSRAGREPRRAAPRGVDLGGARGARLLPPPRRGDPRGLPGLRVPLEAQGGALGARRRDRVRARRSSGPTARARSSGSRRTRTASSSQRRT